KGDLYHHHGIPGTFEFASLTSAMNEMAIQLRDRIETIENQRADQQAIFSSMTEGVLAVNEDERVISMNRAFAELFDIQEKHARGHRVQTLFRQPQLHKLISEVFETHERVEREIILYHGKEKILQVHGAPLLDSENKRRGVVIVLSDITRLRRLEKSRREFVANVSHEIKTPLTSIKGYIETLIDDNFDDLETAKKFLNISLNHINNLDAIIDDLLNLSNLERLEEGDSLQVEDVSILSILKDSIELLQHTADKHNDEINLECDPSLSLPVNRNLVRQAVVNLIENAIKYSPDGTKIWLSTKETVADNRGEREEVVQILVRDNGPGISEIHQPYLFERFYRADKSRSRKLGGTGLGLAITKHIVQAHNGKVAVQSEKGKGATFILQFPRKRQKNESPDG
ncbi:cell wall metabolism sensor histidine kinase WalK, partial [bacterium]|nr:cell wall metabolism sensor histidine kinase WalK [bacterium]